MVKANLIWCLWNSDMFKSEWLILQWLIRILTLDGPVSLSSFLSLFLVRNICRNCKKKQRSSSWNVFDSLQFLCKALFSFHSIMSASNEIGQWYKSIPPITRVWFTASIVVPLAARFGLVSPVHLVLFVRPIVENFQVKFFFDSMIIFLLQSFVNRFGDCSHRFSSIPLDSTF